MHKDISGVLTVSTCLLNRDRNSVSDFTQTSPPLPSSQSHMCPSLLSVVSSCLWQYHWHPTGKKKKNPEMSASSRLELPAHPSACFTYAHGILAIRILQLITHISRFFFTSSSRDVGKKERSICQAGFQTVKKSGGHVFWFFFLPFLFLILSTKNEKLSRVLTLMRSSS